MLLTLAVFPALAAALTLPRVEDAAIVVDGRADEAAWARGLALPDATIFSPSADLPAVGSVRTTVLADDTALYVSFVVTDPEPTLVRAGLGRRDDRWNDDSVGISIDPSGDGRRSLLFRANGLGVQSDALHLPGTMDEDWSWDADWRSAGHLTPTGFEVEFAIPWAAARLSGTVDHFGLLVFRELARKSQGYAWPSVATGQEYLLFQAQLDGPGLLPRRLGIEIRPEVTGAWSDPHVESGRLEVAGVGPGVTIRYAPTNSFGALATFNPDFSQLESDATQIDVNQRYALYYEEKRPFFLEGADWFEHPLDGMVYTRAMNAPLYGARASGEVGRVGYASLHTMDMAPPPSVSEGGGWTADQLDGNPALASLARIRVGLGGDSYIGVLGSDRTVLNSGLYNRVFGLDSVLRVEQRATIEAAVVGSATTPSAGEAPVAASAGTLGMAWRGEKLNLHAQGTAIAPGFRQENGFVTRADQVGAMTEDHFKLYPDVDWLALVSIEPVDVWSYWRFDGSPRERGWDPSVWAQFGNGAFLKLDGRFAGEEFADTWIDYANSEMYLYVSAGSALGVEVWGTLGTSPFYDPANPRAGWREYGGTAITLQPVPRFTFTVGPGVDHMSDLEGTPLYLAWTGRAKAELFLDRTVWVRTVGEVTGEESAVQSWRVEPVAAWEWTPGRAAYLGGSYGVDEAPYWQVYGKVGWVFTL